MTQHHDPVHPDQGDVEPFDELSPADDAYVSALLADLPDVPMPADVRARIDAALAELPAVAAPAGAATVVPIGAARSRWRNPRILQAAAALVLVVAAVAIGIKGTTTDTPTADTKAGAPPPSAASAGAGAAEAASSTGTAYTTQTLAAGIRSLIATHGRAAFSAGGDTTSGNGSTATPGQTPQPPVAAGTPDAHTTGALRSLVTDVTRLGRCINAIETDVPYTQPIAIDAATYNGQPALLVVLPNPDQPSTYGVWIVEPTCGVDGDAHLISFQAVPRA